MVSVASRTDLRCLIILRLPVSCFKVFQSLQTTSTSPNISNMLETFSGGFPALCCKSGRGVQDQEPFAGLRIGEVELRGRMPRLCAISQKAFKRPAASWHPRTCPCRYSTPRARARSLAQWRQRSHRAARPPQAAGSSGNRDPPASVNCHWVCFKAKI